MVSHALVFEHWRKLRQRCARLRRNLGRRLPSHSDNSSCRNSSNSNSNTINSSSALHLLECTRSLNRLVSISSSNISNSSYSSSASNSFGSSSYGSVTANNRYESDSSKRPKCKSNYEWRSSRDSYVLSAYPIYNSSIFCKTSIFTSGRILIS